MICKYPEYMKSFAVEIEQIIMDLMSKEIRMETTGLQLATALFERIGVSNDGF